MSHVTKAAEAFAFGEPFGMTSFNIGLEV